MSCSATQLLIYHINRQHQKVFRQNLVPEQVPHTERFLHRRVCQRVLVQPEINMQVMELMADQGLRGECAKCNYLFYIEVAKTQLEDETLVLS